MRPIAIDSGRPGPGWSNVYGVDFPRNCDSRLTKPRPGLDESSIEDREGILESAMRIESIIQAEIKRGLPPHRIVVGGLSQGGALALHVALRFASPLGRLGGCIALSSWLPLPGDYPAALSESAKSLPVLQVSEGLVETEKLSWTPPPLPLPPPPFRRRLDLLCSFFNDTSHSTVVDCQAHGSSDDVVSVEWGHSSYLKLMSMVETGSSFLRIEVGKANHSFVAHQQQE